MSIQDGWYPMPTADRAECEELKLKVEDYLELVEQDAMVLCM